MLQLRISRKIINRQLALFAKADPAYAESVRRALKAIRQILKELLTTRGPGIRPVLRGRAPPWEPSFNDPSLLPLSNLSAPPIVLSDS